MYVFVYGTLKQGYGNHGRLSRFGAELVGEATVEGFDLYDLGYFPAAVEGEGTVQGELFRLIHPDNLQSLDWLEGYAEGSANNLYERRLVPAIATGVKYDAWIYYMTRPRGEKLDGIWPR